MNIKFIFFLLGQKGYQVLASVLGSYGAHIQAVIVGHDQAIQDDFSALIIAKCNDYGIRWIEREDSQGVLADFHGYKFAIGWRWLIEDTNNLIVFHDSLLPKYRGFAPLVNALIQGESRLGASALFATTHYDTGDIIDQKSFEANYPLKIMDAITKVGLLYVEMAHNIMDCLLQEGILPRKKQDESLATYSLWRNARDYFINWYWNADKIARFVDAVGFPYQGAKSYANGQVVTIHHVSPIPDVTIQDRENAVGKILFIEDGLPVIVCHTGLLKIIQLTDKYGNNLLPVKIFRTIFHG